MSTATVCHHDFRLTEKVAAIRYWALEDRGTLPPPPPPPPPPPSAAELAAAAVGRCMPAESPSDPTYTVVHPAAAQPTAGSGSGSCGAGQRGFVGMVTPCTSRKAKFSTVDKSPFAISYLPSVVSTLARSREANLDVVFYVGYDAGEQDHSLVQQSTVLAGCVSKGLALCCRGSGVGHRGGA